MGLWIPVDQDVYSAAPSAIWKNLDLSSIVGSNQAICVFGVNPTNNLRCSLRRNGSTVEPTHVDSSHHGMQYSDIKANDWHVLDVVTDVNGVIQHQQDSVLGTLVLRLLGYCVLSNPGPALLSANHTFPIGSWETYNIASALGAVKGLAFIQYSRTSGFPNGAGVRTPGDTRDGEYVADSTVGGSNRGLLGASGKKGCLFAVETDNDGKYEHSCQSNPASVSPIYYEGAEVDDYVPVNQVVGEFVVVQDGWQDLDISAHIDRRAFCIVKAEIGSTGIQTIWITCRRKGETRDFSWNFGGFGPGIHLIDSSGRAGDLTVECNDDGIIDIHSYISVPPTTSVKFTLVGYIPTNPPPTFSSKSPTGATEKPYVDVSFNVDDDVQVDGSTIDVTFTGPGPVVLQAIINGVFQTGFGGSITANGTGFDVLIDEHPLLGKGSWTIDVEADDDLGLTGTDSWSFTTEWKPELVGSKAARRRAITVEWDLPVRCRSLSVVPVDGIDRYTPVDWVGIGGVITDAQNPDLYTMSRPVGGNLDGAGEAIDLIPVRVDETDGQWFDDGGIRYSYSVNVKMDYDQTARADYRANVGQIVSLYDLSVAGYEDYVGYVLSQVPRSSLRFFDSLPIIAQDLDNEGTGDLLLFCTAIQEVFNRQLEDIDAFFWELCTLEYIRGEWIDNILYDLGDQFSSQFPLTVLEKRKLAKVLVGMYKLKGTCVGMIYAIQFFLGITMTGCRGGWDRAWKLAKGAYPAPIGGNLLWKGAYPNPVGGDVYLGPVGSEIWSFKLLHPTPGIITADELAKIASIIEIIKPAESHYIGVFAP